MFSAPLWLFGLLALAIPLLLHLWSRKPRQVIRVGTLRHVELTADARSWSARLTDPLLLALRLALLITIVFALAGLRLPVRRSAGTSGTLVLVDPALLESRGSEPIPFLDSLARERGWVRLLAPGLPKLQLDGSTPLKSNEPAEPLWSALAEADALVGPRGTIHVVARPRLTLLGGSRPRIRAQLVWHAPSSTDEGEWTAAAWRGGDSTGVITGSGSRAGAVYALDRAAASAACNGCRTILTHSIAILADDSASQDRISTALRVIAEQLHQPVALTTVIDSADAAVSSLPLTDSLLSLGLPLVVLSPAAVAGAGVVDSIWAQWPWPPLARDSADPRLASINQALASRPIAAPPALGDPEATRRGLLLLALLLFGIERWLATRPGRRDS